MPFMQKIERTCCQNDLFTVLSQLIANVRKLTLIGDNFILRLSHSISLLAENFEMNCFYYVLAIYFPTVKFHSTLASTTTCTLSPYFLAHLGQVAYQKMNSLAKKPFC